MKTGMKAAAIVAVIAMATVFLIPMEESDAAISFDMDYGKFDTMHGGSIYVTFTGAVTPTGVTVTVTDGGDEIYREQTVIEPDVYEYKIGLSGLRSEGEHSLKIQFKLDDGSSESFYNGHDSISEIVVVHKNILSSWSTYLVIALAAIVIVVIVYLRIRDKPKAENTMTFEELEAQRKAEMAAKSEKKSAKKASSGTEKKRYTGKK